MPYSRDFSGYHAVTMNGFVNYDCLSQSCMGEMVSEMPGTEATGRGEPPLPRLWA